jgi:chemotaxis signal transduction protein
MSVPSLNEVAALKARLRDLEAETSGLVRRLRAAPEAELAGAHLVLEAGGRDVLLSAASVDEVVRVVALQPVAGAAPAVAGAFSCRGRSLFAIELGAVLEGRAASPVHLDAHLVLLNLSAPIALVVDRVKAVVNGVTLVDEERRGAGREVAVERRAPKIGDLVARVSGKVMPLLDPSTLASLLGDSRGSP